MNVVTHQYHGILEDCITSGDSFLIEDTIEDKINITVPEKRDRFSSIKIYRR